MLANRTSPHNHGARAEPYPWYGTPIWPTPGNPGISLPTSDVDKENQPPPAKSKSLAEKKKVSSKEPDRSHLPSSYLDISLEEIKGEVPVYENAATIRRKLNNLIDKKVKIPGSDKTFIKTTLSKELQEVAQRSHPVKTHNGITNHGPCPRAVATFLKKSGSMAGGDSATYYFGNILLEKMRIWNGEKKTKARQKAEEDFPNGRYRADPANLWITCRADERPTFSEIADLQR